MKKIDSEHYRWVLLQDGDKLYFVASCNHSAAYYSWTIVLNDKEISEYKKHGRSFLNRLSDTIQYSAPGVVGSNSEYNSRRVEIDFDSITT